MRADGVTGTVPIASIRSDYIEDGRLSFVSLARYTSPIPPWPMRAVTSYEPRRVRGSNGMAGKPDYSTVGGRPNRV